MKKYLSKFTLLVLTLTVCPSLLFAKPLSHYPYCPLIKLGDHWRLLELFPQGGGKVRASYGKVGTHMRGHTALISGETTKLGLDAYGRAAKNSIEINPKSTWTRLGKITINGERGILAEVVETGDFGEIKMLQWLTVKEGFAYVLTLGAHTSEFASRRKEFMDVIYTFELKDSPLDWLTGEQREAALSVFEDLSAKIRKISLKSLSAQPAPNPPEAKTQTCSSLLLDTLPTEEQSEKSQQLMQAFFASKAFQSELFPAYARLLSTHFKKLGPVWQTEMQLYITTRYFGY